MGQKKITWSEASAIAHKVANKAFEHLIPPLEEKLEKAAEKAYDKTLKRLGLTATQIALLQEAELLGDAVYECDVRFQRGETYNSVSIGQAAKWVHGKYVPVVAGQRGFVNHRVTVVDEEIAEPVLTLVDELGPLKTRCSQLQGEVREQLTGKSASQVAKVWPEVGPFVNDYFDIKNGPGEVMTVPFSDLIAKYLLALPAPATERSATV
jgi:hypothetical protein